MKAEHSRLHLLKFNVHWLVESYADFIEAPAVCPRFKKKIPLEEFAAHSAECARCSVLNLLITKIERCRDTFVYFSLKEENLEAIRETTAILHGLEKLTKSKNWSTVH